MNPSDYDPRAKLLTVKQAAERLAVQPSTVTRWIKEGKLPVVELSDRNLRVRESDLIEWVDARTERRGSVTRLAFWRVAAPGDREGQARIDALVADTVSGSGDVQESPDGARVARCR